MSTGEYTPATPFDLTSATWLPNTIPMVQHAVTIVLSADEVVAQA